MYAKNVAFQQWLSLQVFVEEETKELYCVLSNFLHMLFLENEEKTNKTKHRKMFS